MSLTTGINSIDSLVQSSWKTQAGQAVTLTYSFLTRVPTNASTNDANGFLPMSAVQMEGVRAALDSWAAVANITFLEVSSNGNIQLGTNNQGKTSSGYAYLPDGHDPVALYLNNVENANRSFADGSFGMSVLIHELGHTLGLKHPGDYDSTGGDVQGPFLPTATDNIDYSQMSYNLGAGFKLNGLYGITPMLYDIQAIQYLYGANMSYHTGADTYSFVRDSALQAIWDAGDTDTFDFSAIAGATVINLNAGSFSSTAPGYNNISIAYNVTIENAIASRGGSIIYGNGAGNVIAGGAGNDVVHQGGGSDQISGNGGVDTVVFVNKLADYQFDGTLRALNVTGEGADLLSNITKLQFSDTTVQLSNYASLVVGTTGKDVFAGAAGNQFIAGGADIDTLVLSGKASSYKLSTSGSAVFISDVIGNGGTDLMTGVERLTFSDSSMALDTLGAAGSIYRLYSVFNRGPDSLGMGFWIEKTDQGASITSIASGFVNSPEFNRTYGADVTNTVFLTALYNNVLHRTPDAAGLHSWENLMASGASRADVMVGFTDSAENIGVMASIIGVGIAYTPYLG